MDDDEPSVALAQIITVMHITAMTERPTLQAYGELQRVYDFYNDRLFAGQLPPCLITLQRQKRTYGFFTRGRFGTRDGRTTDEIAINPEYFATVPLVEVLQTLVHEMAHLWQNHFGKPSRACYHNTEWADKMEALGLMPSSTGREGGRRVGQHMADYVIVGGRFEAETAKLLEDGFLITWLDRYPAPAPAVPGPGPGATRRPDTAAGEADPKYSRLNLPAEALVAPVTPSTSAEAVAATYQNRSNRVKYSCPGCGASCWGKPGLRLGCMDCNCKFASVSGGV